MKERSVTHQAAAPKNTLSAPLTQGGPLSPLLSNILLDDLDKELEARKLRFVRYADDLNVYVKSKRAAERVLTSVTRFLRKKLRLKVNEEKSKVDRPWNRVFLGYTMTSESHTLAPMEETMDQA